MRASTTQKKPAARRSEINLPMATLAMAVASASYFPSASAQMEQEQNMRFIEEVVVTARRREENLQDVPISVTAMSDDFLREQNITEIEDLGTNVPSLRISSAGGSVNEPLISIRGQRTAESSLNLDQAAPMYFNEVVMTPNQGTNLSMFDLQNVQVLKGPQGTLFGRNSTGGAVLLTPKRPGYELGGYAEVKVGNYDLRSFEGAVDVPVNDNLQMRFAARKVDRDGYQKNIADNALNGERFRDENSESLRWSINYEQDGFSSLTVLAYDENKTLAPVPVAAGVNPSSPILALYPDYQPAVQDQVNRDDPWKVKTDVKGREEVRNIFASNTTEFELSDNLTLKNVFGYRKINFETVTDTDGTALPFSGAYTASGSYTGLGYTDFSSPVSGATFNPPMTETDAEQFSNEIQLLGVAFDERLEWITGAYWYQLEGTTDQIVQQVGPRPLFGFAGIINDTSTTAENTAYGLFAEGTWHFDEAWSVTAGLRQSWDERELTVNRFEGSPQAPNCVVTDVNGNPASNCERTVDESFSSPTWRMSVNYKPTDAHLIYGSLSTGYRAGGFNSRGVDNITLQPFDEETVMTLELGHKADWNFDWATVRTNLAVFMQDYEDIQQTVSVSTPTNPIATTTRNAAEAEINGVEFDVTLMPTDSLELKLAYSFIDAEYQDNIATVNTDVTSYQVDASGNDFVYIPEQSVTASIAYTLPVDVQLGEMSVMASYYWQSEMTLNEGYDQFPLYARDNGWTDAELAAVQDASKEDEYGVLNLRFDWRNVMNSNFDVAAFVNNATDEEYILGGLNVIQSLYASYTYGAPRTFGASVRYSF